MRRAPLTPAEKPMQRWSLDFEMDFLGSGRWFRSFNSVDDCSRECPGLLVDTSVGGVRVTRFLDQLAETHGLPGTMVIDNGSAFTSRPSWHGPKRQRGPPAQLAQQPHAGRAQSGHGHPGDGRVNCTFPQRDYCYYFQPGSSHPEWTNLGVQVAEKRSGTAAGTPSALAWGAAPLRRRPPRPFQAV